MPQPWDQLPAETGAAYKAFTAYLYLGPQRTLDAAYRGSIAAQQGDQSRSKRASGRWKLWTKQHAWSERARAWDERDRRVAEEARSEVIRVDAAAQTREQLRSQRRIEQEESEWKARGLLVDKAMEMLGTTLFAKKAAVNGQSVEIKPARWTMLTAVYMLELAGKLGRMSARMPASVEDEPDGDADDKFFETSGQLADAIAPSKVPDMPADTHVKPPLAIAQAQAGKNGNPIQPPKARP